MEKIIDPISKITLKSELNPATFIRKTNFGSNLIYIVNIHNSPNTLLEIGRLREIAFRDGGGGTGKSYDLDEFDTGEICFQQIVVWDPEEEEIVGGYRYIKGSEATQSDGSLCLATQELFDYSPKFIKEFLPKTIELGRSFIQPKYQGRGEGRKGLFSMDNLWDGLGAVAIDNPDCRYFFGKMTMYGSFQEDARDYILTFLKIFFPDHDQLVFPKNGLGRGIKIERPEFIEEIKGLPYKAAHLILNQKVRSLGENIPPLFNSYMNASPEMRVMGTAINHHFGEVEETAILIPFDGIYPTKKERYLLSYANQKSQF
jgi:hypothetical protein